MIDLHSHSVFSADGKDLPELMIESAISKGCKVFGFSEHLDYDYHFSDIKLRQLDVPAYFENMTRLKNLYADKIKLLTGIECGFHPLIDDRYSVVQRQYSNQLDYTVNSVHLIKNLDPFFKKYFDGKDKQTAYGLYLEFVLQSVLTKDYDYQIIGHIGYLMRYAPYQNRVLKLSSHRDLFDEILNNIIRLEKTIEVNSGITDPLPFMPPAPVLERYFELGGRLVSFGSDCHNVQRVGDKYGEVTDMLRSIGFKQLCSFEKGEMLLHNI